LPSFTLCPRDHDWEYVEKKRFKNNDLSRGNIIKYKFQNTKDLKRKWSIDVVYQPLSKLQHYSPPFENEQYLSSMTDLILTNISSLKCMTFFSKLQLKSKLQIDFAIKKPLMKLDIISNHDISFLFSIHNPNELVKNISNKIDIEYLRYNKITYKLKVMTRHLLPYPYDTNCQDYSNNMNNDEAPKSQMECKESCLKHKNIDCFCKNDCKTETFNLFESGYTSQMKKTDIRLQIFIFRTNKEENFYHLPAMTWIDYVCTIGSILCLWCGLSFNQIITFIIQNIENSIRKSSLKYKIRLGFIFLLLNHIKNLVFY